MKFHWHAYGPRADGTFYLFGPSGASPEDAATFGSFVGLPYVQSWDHEPTADEMAATP